MKDILNYLHEIGQLTKVANSGWWLIGVENPPSVAEHVFRASTIAFVIAKLEGASPEKASAITLFHDMHESRITDLHKVAQKYVDLREADVEALRDQLMSLPNEVAASIKNMFDSYSTENTKEGIIARDADLLEYGFQAKEFMVKGYKDAEIWLDNINKLVKTPTAKKLATQLYDSNPNEWWKGLKKIER